jgi:predicted Zn-dependent protease
MGSRTKRDIAHKGRTKECVDYDEAMKSWFQVALMFLCVQSAWAQAVTPSAAPQERSTAQKSGLDAMLFYQLLLGEMNVRSGAPGSGFSIILDAARKTRDPLVFQRAVDVALQSRSGDAALQAAQAWKSAIPESSEANRYLLQILLALNRVDEAGQALSVSIRELPANERAAAIASIPRVFGRVQDKKLAADTVEKALQSALKPPARPCWQMPPPLAPWCWP